MFTKVYIDISTQSKEQRKRHFVNLYKCYPDIKGWVLHCWNISWKMGTFFWDHCVLTPGDPSGFLGPQRGVNLQFLQWWGNKLFWTIIVGARERESMEMKISVSFAFNWLINWSLIQGLKISTWNDRANKSQQFRTLIDEFGLVWI